MATANGESTKILWDDCNRYMRVGKNGLGAPVVMNCKLDLTSCLLVTTFYVNGLACGLDEVRYYDRAFLPGGQAPGTDIENLRSRFLSHYKTVEVEDIPGTVKFDNHMERMRITGSPFGPDIWMDCRRFYRNGKLKVQARFWKFQLGRWTEAQDYEISRRGLIRQLQNEPHWESVATQMWIDHYGMPSVQQPSRKSRGRNKMRSAGHNNDSSSLHHSVSRPKLSNDTIKSEPDADTIKCEPDTND